MFNEMIVVTVTNFSGTTTPDKNGELPVMLQCIAGRMPNRNVLDGTVAKRAGIEVNKVYLVQCREVGYDKQFGKDFTFTKVKELETALDIVKTTQELGPSEIVQIARPEGYEDTYERKGNSIEGQRTKRIKEGLYEPIIHRNIDHETASEVKQGTSTETEQQQGAQVRNRNTLNT